MHLNLLTLKNDNAEFIAVKGAGEYKGKYSLLSISVPPSINATVEKKNRLEM